MFTPGCLSWNRPSGVGTGAGRVRKSRKSTRSVVLAVPVVAVQPVGPPRMPLATSPRPATSSVDGPSGEPHQFWIASRRYLLVRPGSCVQTAKAASWRKPIRLRWMLLMLKRVCDVLMEFCTSMPASELSVNEFSTVTVLARLRTR